MKKNKTTSTDINHTEKSEKRRLFNKNYSMNI